MRRVLLSAIACVATISLLAQPKAGDKKINYKEVGAPLPPVKLVVPLDLKEATLFNSDSLHKAPIKSWYVTNRAFSNKHNTFVMLFNPTCEHCADQTHLFMENIDVFKKNNTKIYLVAGDQMMSYLEYFDSGLKVSTQPDVFTMGVDSSGIIDHTFLYQSLPQINIYDKKQKLIKVFNGNIPMDSLTTYIK